MKKYILQFVLFLSIMLFSFSAFSQNTVTGVVRDAATGETLLGVNIMEKGTTNGTISDVNGNYQLKLTGSDATIVFSYIGYVKVEEPVNGRSEINVNLSTDSKMVNEVMVVGYGTQKKESVVGSISSINNKTLVSIPVSNLSQSIAGKLSGVQIVQSSGEIGRDEAEIYVRGRATWGDAKPLIVVDGIVRDNFAQIDPNEIQSLNVLKDASATAVFGVKGANGVIIITTKRGTTGKPKISFTAQTAVTQTTRIPEPLDSYRSAMLENMHKVGGLSQSAPWDTEDLMLFRTNASPYTNPDFTWVDVIMKDHSQQSQYNLNVSGGTETIKYFVSGGYFTQDGMYNYDKNTNFTRFNFRSNFDIRVTKNFSAAINLGARIQTTKNPASAWYGSWDIYRGSFANAGRYIPVFNPDGSLGGSSSYNNLVGVVRDMGFFTETRSILELGINLDYKLDFIIKGLSAKGQVAFDDNAYLNKMYQSSFARYQYDFAKDKYTEIGENRPLAYNWGNVNDTRKVYYELGLNYSRTFGKIDVTGLLLANRDLRNVNEQTAYASEGIVGRMTFSYDSRYLTELNMGFNGSENFPADSRYGFFPAVALGWVLTNEPFFMNSQLSKVLTSFKVRGSMGLVGNDKLWLNGVEQRFLYLQQYAESGGATFGTGDNWYGGIQQGKIANLNVQWEVALKQNIGFEAEFYQGLLELNFDYFFENRDKILTEQPNTAPFYVGAEFYPANVGIVENKGFEMELKHNKIFSGGFSYFIKGNLSYAHNTVVQRDDAYMTLDYQKEAGYSIGTPLVYIQTGIFQSYEDIYNSPAQIADLGGINGNNAVYPGDLKFKDLNGDNVINQYDRMRSGYSTVPEIGYGMQLGFNYKGFDVSVLIQGSARAAFDKNWEIMWHFSNNANVFPKHWNYWTPETSGNEQYTRIYGAYQNNESGSTYSLGSGDYVRLKTAEIGYEIPKTLAKKLHIEGIRIYLSGVNLFIWAKERYLDPDNRNSRGGFMPPLKSYNIGVNVNF